MNHEFFWENLCPPDKFMPLRENMELTKLIVQAFGSFDQFVETFSTKTAALQGSGWGWLVYNKSAASVEYKQTANQDRIEDPNLVPLLTIDIWEHAYYIDYQNVRPNFLKEIWKIIDWKVVY